MTFQEEWEPCQKAESKESTTVSNQSVQDCSVAINVVRIRNVLIITPQMPKVNTWQCCQSRPQ